MTDINGAGKKELERFFEKTERHRIEVLKKRKKYWFEDLWGLDDD